MPSRKIFHAEAMQVVKLVTKDGLTLQSWYKAANPGKPTLLFLHGNAGHIGFRMPMANQWLAAGYGVLLLEYRGYGGNPGHPGEQGLYLDGIAAMAFLKEQGVTPSSTVLYGESLGTGVATYLAINYPVCAVILQSPFTSLPALARVHYPWIMIQPWDKFDSLSRIADIQAPLLILHGRNDAIVPYQQGVELFARAREPKLFVELPGKGHNDLWDQTFVNDILRFIKANCT
ncbi:alpha/beta hydrolase [Legionella spiritensis]